MLHSRTFCLLNLLSFLRDSYQSFLQARLPGRSAVLLSGVGEKGRQEGNIYWMPALCLNLTWALSLT